MTKPDNRPRRTKFRDLTMGALLAVVMAGGLTALISQAERTARAAETEMADLPPATDHDCEWFAR